MNCLNEQLLKSLGIDMINIAAYDANDKKLKAKFSFHVEDFIKNYNDVRKNDESFGNLSEDKQNQLKYKVNFRTKNDHPENTLRNFFIYQLKDNILSSVKSKDNKSITDIVKKLLDISNNTSISPVERTEAQVIYSFLTSDTISDKLVLKGLDAAGKYVSEDVDHEEVLSILLSNTTINQLLEKHLVGLGKFIINTGSKVKSRKTIKLTDLLSKSNVGFKSASENIIANNTANIPSMFISEGELPSTADLEFSEYVDRVGRRGRLQVKISNKETGNATKLTDNFNKIYETHKFNEEVVDNLLISLFSTLDNHFIETFKDEDLTRIQTEYLLLKKSRKSGDIKFKKAIELLNFIIEKDNEINNFKLVSDRFDKYIKSSALRYGFTSKTGDSHYEKIFKSLITPLDENQEVTERIDDPITQLSRMAEAIISGYITRKHMDLRLGKNRNEVLDLTISGKSSFKILRNGVETVDDKKYRIRTNNTDLFTNDELVGSVKNGTIPTFTLGDRFGVNNFRLPEILFFPFADVLDIKGYLAEVIKALNPGINLKSFETELFRRFPSSGTEGNQVQYLVIRKEENDFKVAFQNAHSMIVNEQNNDLKSRRTIAIDNIKSFVNNNTLNDTFIGLSYESPHLKDENGESIKIKDLTWGELVDNLRLEAEALQTQNIQETGRNKGTNYADLKDYPLLSLFLMSSETTTNVNKSNQFSMAAYFNQPVTGSLNAPKVSINPYYEKSLERNKAVILAQQLVLISNSSTTDITPGNKAVIGSRFSTTGSITVSSSFDTMSTETSRNKDKEAEIKAKENSIIRELTKAKTLFNTDIDLTNNKNFWFLQNPLSSFISKDIDSEDIINLYKIFLAKKLATDDNKGDIGFEKTRRGLYFNNDDTIINELSKEDYYKLQEYVLENDFNNTFEDYEKFFKHVKSLDNSSIKTYLRASSTTIIPKVEAISSLKSQNIKNIVNSFFAELKEKDPLFVKNVDDQLLKNFLEFLKNNLKTLNDVYDKENNKNSEQSKITTLKNRIDNLENLINDLEKSVNSEIKSQSYNLFLSEIKAVLSKRFNVKDGKYISTVEEDSMESLQYDENSSETRDNMKRVLMLVKSLFQDIEIYTNLVNKENEIIERDDFSNIGLYYEPLKVISIIQDILKNNDISSNVDIAKKVIMKRLSEVPEYKKILERVVQIFEDPTRTTQFLSAINLSHTDYFQVTIGKNNAKITNGTEAILFSQAKSEAVSELSRLNVLVKNDGNGFVLNTENIKELDKKLKSKTNTYKSLISLQYGANKDKSFPVNISNEQKVREYFQENTLMIRGQKVNEKNYYNFLAQALKDAIETYSYNRGLVKDSERKDLASTLEYFIKIEEDKEVNTLNKLSRLLAVNSNSFDSVIKAGDISLQVNQKHSLLTLLKKELFSNSDNFDKLKRFSTLLSKGQNNSFGLISIIKNQDNTKRFSELNEIEFELVKLAALGENMAVFKTTSDKSPKPIFSLDTLKYTRVKDINKEFIPYISYELLRVVKTIIDSKNKNFEESNGLKLGTDVVKKDNKLYEGLSAFIFNFPELNANREFISFKEEFYSGKFDRYTDDALTDHVEKFVNNFIKKQDTLLKTIESESDKIYNNYHKIKIFKKLEKSEEESVKGSTLDVLKELYKSSKNENILNILIKINPKVENEDYDTNEGHNLNRFYEEVSRIIAYNQLRSNIESDFLIGDPTDNNKINEKYYYKYEEVEDLEVMKKSNSLKPNIVYYNNEEGFIKLPNNSIVDLNAIDPTKPIFNFKEAVKTVSDQNTKRYSILLGTGGIGSYFEKNYFVSISKDRKVYSLAAEAYASQNSGIIINKSDKTGSKDGKTFTEDLYKEWQVRYEEFFGAGKAGDAAVLITEVEAFHRMLAGGFKYGEGKNSDILAWIKKFAPNFYEYRTEVRKAFNKAVEENKSDFTISKKINGSVETIKFYIHERNKTVLEKETDPEKENFYKTVEESYKYITQGDTNGVEGSEVLFQKYFELNEAFIADEKIISADNYLDDIVQVPLNAQKPVEGTMVKKVDLYNTILYIKSAAFPVSENQSEDSPLGKLMFEGAIKGVHRHAYESATKKYTNIPSSIYKGDGNNLTYNPDYFKNSKSKNLEFGSHTNIALMKNDNYFDQLNTTYEEKSQTSNSTQQEILLKSDRKAEESFKVAIGENVSESVRIEKVFNDFDKATRDLIIYRLVDYLESIGATITDDKNKTVEFSEISKKLDLSTNINNINDDFITNFFGKLNVRILDNTKLNDFLRRVSSDSPELLEKLELTDKKQFKIPLSFLSGIESKITSAFYKGVTRIKLPGSQYIQTPEDIIIDVEKDKKNFSDKVPTNNSDVFFIDGKKRNKLKSVRLGKIVNGKAVELDASDEANINYKNAIDALENFVKNKDNSIDIQKHIKDIDENFVILPAEVILPSAMFSKSTFEVLKTLKFDDEFLQLVAFRIPYQGPSSGLPFTIVGFSDSNRTGNNVILPSEITITMGSDFDIDKISFYIKHFEISDGVLKTLESTQEEKVSSDNIYDSIKSNKEETLKSLSNKDKILIEKIILDNQDDTGNLGRKFENAFFKEFENKTFIVKKGDKKKELENTLIDSYYKMYVNPFAYLQTIKRQENEDIDKSINNIEVDKESNDVITLIEDFLYYNTEIVNQPSYQKMIHFANNTGKTGLGIAVVKAIHHILSQSIKDYSNNSINFYENGKLISDDLKALTSTNYYDEEQYYLDKETNKGLWKYGHEFSVKDKNGKSAKISDLFRQFINIYVDNANDQKVGQLGIHIKALPIALELISKRIPLDDVISFIKQPIINEIIYEMELSDNIFSEDIVKDFSAAAKSVIREKIKDNKDFKDILESETEKFLFNLEQKVAGFNSFENLRNSSKVENKLYHEIAVALEAIKADENATTTTNVMNVYSQYRKSLGMDVSKINNVKQSKKALVESGRKPKAALNRYNASHIGTSHAMVEMFLKTFTDKTNLYFIEGLDVYTNLINKFITYNSKEALSGKNLAIFDKNIKAMILSSPKILDVLEPGIKHNNDDVKALRQRYLDKETGLINTFYKLKQDLQSNNIVFEPLEQLGVDNIGEEFQLLGYSYTTDTVVGQNYFLSGLMFTTENAAQDMLSKRVQQFFTDLIAYSFYVNNSSFSSKILFKYIPISIYKETNIGEMMDESIRTFSTQSSREGVEDILFENILRHSPSLIKSSKKLEEGKFTSLGGVLDDQYYYVNRKEVSIPSSFTTKEFDDAYVKIKSHTYSTDGLKIYKENIYKKTNEDTYEYLEPLGLDNGKISEYLFTDQIEKSNINGFKNPTLNSIYDSENKINALKDNYNRMLVDRYSNSLTTIFNVNTNYEIIAFQKMIDYLEKLENLIGSENIDSFNNLLTLYSFNNTIELKETLKVSKLLSDLLVSIKLNNHYEEVLKGINITINKTEFTEEEVIPYVDLLKTDNFEYFVEFIKTTKDEGVENIDDFFESLIVINRGMVKFKDDITLDKDLYKLILDLMKDFNNTASISNNIKMKVLDKKTKVSDSNLKKELKLIEENLINLDHLYKSNPALFYNFSKSVVKLSNDVIGVNNIMKDIADNNFIINSEILNKYKSKLSFTEKDGNYYIKYDNDILKVFKNDGENLFLSKNPDNSIINEKFKPLNKIGDIKTEDNYTDEELLEILNEEEYKELKDYNNSNSEESLLPEVREELLRRLSCK